MRFDVAVHYANYKGSADLNLTFNQAGWYPSVDFTIYEDAACINELGSGSLQFDYYDNTNKIAYYYWDSDGGVC